MLFGKIEHLSARSLARLSLKLSGRARVRQRHVGSLTSAHSISRPGKIGQFDDDDDETRYDFMLAQSEIAPLQRATATRQQQRGHATSLCNASFQLRLVAEFFCAREHNNTRPLS